jgi:branched-chain amino acid transport system permease protein
VSIAGTQTVRLPHRTMLLVFAVVMVLLPQALANKYQVSVLIIAGIHVLLALGLNLVMGYTGQVSLGHAGFYGLGAYASGVLTTKYGVNPWLAFLAALALTCAVSGFIGAVALRLQGYYLSMATLGFGIILYILFVELSWLTGGPAGLVGIPELRLGALRIASDAAYYYLVWTIVVITLLFSFHLVDSRVGRALRAIQGDETAASLVGINTWATKVMIFVVAAGMASAAGSLYAHYVTVLTPDSFGFLFSIELVVMVIVGGSGSVWGALLGAILLTLLPEYLRVMKDYDVLIYGVIVIVVVMFAPRGIAGGLEHRLRRRRLSKASS